jgi:hypothetical protein
MMVADRKLQLLAWLNSSLLSKKMEQPLLVTHLKLLMAHRAFC